ncbi:hypothetical protein RZS08_61950, partial [Arthrospira platensis SPKY1]|nr:hypothetical protein [Arthrospira platensis SPKY1]
MHDHRAGIEVEQEILRPPPHCRQTLAGDRRGQVLGHRLAQPRVAHDQGRQAPALDMRPNAPAGGFDFGEFGHRAADRQEDVNGNEYGRGGGGTAGPRRVAG